MLSCLCNIQIEAKEAAKNNGKEEASNGTINDTLG